MKTVRDRLEEQRERMQEDLLCILDGLDTKTLSSVCDVVIDRFNYLITELCCATVQSAKFQDKKIDQSTVG